MKHWLAVGLLLSTIGVSACSQQSVEETRSLELPVEAIKSLDIDTTSGDLIITGDEKATSIRAEAVIRGPKNMSADSVVFSLEKQGDVAKLVSDIQGAFIMQEMSIDLKVTLPPNLSVKLKDGSGDMKITNINAPLFIRDDSGDIQITDVSEELTLEDGSGDIRINNAKAIKSIVDDAGELILNKTGGDVEITDGSGNTEIKNHSGNVKIIDDSGEITVKDLNGSLVVSDGSGNITIDHVSKDVTIENDDSGDVSVKDVKGAYTKK